MSDHGNSWIKTGEDICKYNQTGFCKFRDHCRKKHENETCEGEQSNCNQQNCNKRHPKVCRNFNTTRKCRFKDDCVYLHVEKENSNNKSEINETSTKIMRKHENEIVLINAKMDKLKEIVLDMGDKIKSMEIKLKGFNKIDALTQDNDVHIIEDDDTEKESVKLDDKWMYCDMCPYKCKKQKTFEKHTQNQHKNFKKCENCGKNYDNAEILTEHMIKEHTEIHAENQDVLCAKCTMTNCCICEWLDKAMELESK